MHQIIVFQKSPSPHLEHAQTKHEKMKLLINVSWHEADQFQYQNAILEILGSKYVYSRKKKNQNTNERNTPHDEQFQQPELRETV